MSMKDWLAYTNPIVLIAVLPITIGIFIAATLKAVFSSKVIRNTVHVVQTMDEDMSI